MARYDVNRLARFSSPDPQSLNRYTYARNNPINLVDPSGAAVHPTDYYLVGSTGGEGVIFGSNWNEFDLMQIHFFTRQWTKDGWYHWVVGNGLDVVPPNIGPPSFPPNLPPGIGAKQRQPALPDCAMASLDDPNLFWDDSFATPDQVQAFMEAQSNAPGNWDAYLAADAFQRAGLNPGLAVGIIFAETSFNPTYPGNVTNPFSVSGATNFQQSYTGAVHTIAKLEYHTWTDNIPLQALTNQQNDLGQLYTATQKDIWRDNINAAFRQFAAFIGDCLFYH